MEESIRLAALAALEDQGVIALAVMREGNVVHASPAFSDLFGLGARFEALGPFDARVAAEDRERITRVLAAGGRGRTGPVSFRGARPEGSQFEAELAFTQTQLPDGPATVVVVNDVSGLRETQSQLSYLAFLDPLTGLPNRAHFLDRLRQALVDARVAGTGFAVLMTDLDGFKAVNDSRGHDAGDQLLKTVGLRLRGAARGSDVVARLGGDEFALLLPGVGRSEDAAIAAGRLVRAVEAVGTEREAPIGLSAGVALYPQNGVDIDTLLARADAAMYQAKRAGKNRYCLAEGDTGASRALPFVAWDESMCVGVAVIDEQHSRLVDLINRLGNDMKAGHGLDRLVRSLADLVDFTRHHFATEEALMSSAALEDGGRNHARVHERLLDDLHSLSINLDGRSMMLTMRYLQEWLVRHVEQMDRPLAKALIEAGVV